VDYEEKSLIFAHRSPATKKRLSKALIILPCSEKREGGTEVQIRKGRAVIVSIKL